MTTTNENKPTKHDPNKCCTKIERTNGCCVLCIFNLSVHFLAGVLCDEVTTTSNQLFHYSLHFFSSYLLFFQQELKVHDKRNEKATKRTPMKLNVTREQNIQCCFVHNCSGNEEQRNDGKRQQTMEPKREQSNEQKYLKKQKRQPSLCFCNEIPCSIEEGKIFSYFNEKKVRQN